MSCNGDLLFHLFRAMFFLSQNEDTDNITGIPQHTRSSHTISTVIACSAYNQYMVFLFICLCHNTTCHRHRCLFHQNHRWNSDFLYGATIDLSCLTAIYDIFHANLAFLSRFAKRYTSHHMVTPCYYMQL